MSALALSFVASFALSLVLERVPPGSGLVRMAGPALLARLALHLFLFAAFFALSWRPFHAGFVTVALAGLFAAGDATKRRILGEPLLFSDFALVRLAIRHPRLYYADRLKSPKVLAVLAAVVLATVAWFWIEPTILPPSAPWLLLAPPALAALLLVAARTAGASRVAQRIVGDHPLPEKDVERFGLGAAMLLHWLAWRRKERPSEAARVVMAQTPATPSAIRPAVVVAIQCESFVDLAARGLRGPALPLWTEMRESAAAWGKVRVPAAEGAYTMRSEFGFLTGLPNDALGLDGFDPYLTAEPYAEASIARRCVEGSRRTLFIHPYDRRFFERERVMMALGFERMIYGEAFEDAERLGPYVSDAALADVIVAEIEAAREPLFIFAVSIENHGPWGPGRIAGVDEPAAQYALHLESADRMVGRVAEALRRKPGGGVLCAYGDHAPARTLHPELPDRDCADYVLWDSRGEQTRTSARDLPIDALGRLLRSRI
ncbi:LTA synthase family protein [Hansschlegelia quercus]|uniref:LTA synthase family protein n=1 Tax=Hansschlegelia quercus TaxID=2528245 RepID=A0A4Q9GME6_9HYPH|nr:LTA synthase family protein [Hansschlegelia quercus]TBN53884.1 LTA synthase family protein [Hansschlegelia quercus]